MSRMHECCVGIEINWHHRSTTTITTMADHSRRWQKCPPNAPHEAFRLVPTHQIDVWRTPEQADTIFKGLRGCMALITLRCYGDASLPEQRSALRAIHPLNTPNIISACSGDCHPWIWCIGMRQNALCGALGGHFCHWWPWLWWCFVACRSTNHFFWLNHGIVGIARKLLSQARRFLHCTKAET